jgi:hypothetical protein
MTRITRPTLRAAIDRECRDCTYDPPCLGTCREQVAQCSSPDNSLWAVRIEPRWRPFAQLPRDPKLLSQEWRRSPNWGSRIAASVVGIGRKQFRPPTLPHSDCCRTPACARGNVSFWSVTVA